MLTTFEIQLALIILATWAAVGAFGEWYIKRLDRAWMLANLKALPVANDVHSEETIVV